MALNTAQMTGGGGGVRGDERPEKPVWTTHAWGGRHRMAPAPHTAHRSFSQALGQ